MAGYKTTDVVEVLARKDETGQAVRGRLGLRSAVARMANKIEMNSRVAGFLDIARPEAHFSNYAATRTGALVAASSIQMEAKPLTVTLVFDKYMERDVADFSRQFTQKLGDAFAEALDRDHGFRGEPGPRPSADQRLEHADASRHHARDRFRPGRCPERCGAEAASGRGGRG